MILLTRTLITLRLMRVRAPLSPNIPNVDHLLAVIQPQEPLQIFPVGLKCSLLLEYSSRYYSTTVLGRTTVVVKVDDW